MQQLYSVLGRVAAWKLWTKVSDTQQLGAHYFYFNFTKHDKNTGKLKLDKIYYHFASLVQDDVVRYNAAVVYILSCCTVHHVRFIYSEQLIEL